VLTSGTRLVYGSETTVTAVWIDKNDAAPAFAAFEMQETQNEALVLVSDLPSLAVGDTLTRATGVTYEVDSPLMADAGMWRAMMRDT
jgi:hypothetical protein